MYKVDLYALHSFAHFVEFLHSCFEQQQAVPIMNNGDTQDVPRKITKQDLSDKAMQVSECMLGTYRCTIASVIVGTFLGLRRKHVRPFVYAITLGTLGDLLYGYTNVCRPLINDYERAKLEIKGIVPPTPQNIDVLQALKTSVSESINKK